MLGAQRGLIMVIENFGRLPSSAKYATFLNFTAFQACAYGFAIKWTCFALTHQAPACFNKSCPGPERARARLSWGRDAKAPNSFATSLQTAYPFPLARDIAQAFRATQANVGEISCPFNLQRIRAAVGIQPKASLSTDWPVPQSCVCDRKVVPKYAQLLSCHLVRVMGGITAPLGLTLPGRYPLSS